MTVQPASGLLLDSSGNLDGTGSAGWGNIFKVTQAGVFTVLHSFTGQEQPPDGGSPRGWSSAGCLWQPVWHHRQWRHHRLGTVYKTTTAGTESLLYNFTDGADGGQPRSTLVLDSSGNIYGTASDGGNSQCSVGSVRRLRDGLQGLFHRCGNHASCFQWWHGRRIAQRRLGAGRTGQPVRYDR